MLYNACWIFFFFFFFLNPTFIAKQLLLDSTQIAHLLLNGFIGIFLLYFFGEALVVIHLYLRKRLHA